MIELSDQKLRELWASCPHIDEPEGGIRFARAALAAAQGEAGDGPPPTRRQLMMLAEEMGLTSVGDAAIYARAVLARWGRPAQPALPAKGEVAELVRWLKKYANSDWIPDETTDKIARAAELLVQSHPTPPAEGGMGELNAAINVIESVAGFTDADTPVGEAWAVVMAQLKATAPPAPPAEGEIAELVAALRGPLAKPWEGLHGEIVLNRTADLLSYVPPPPTTDN